MKQLIIMVPYINFNEDFDYIMKIFDYIMKIFDYIFFRVFTKYQHTKDYPYLFVSWLFITVCLSFILMFIFGLIHSLIENLPQVLKKGVYFIYLLIISFFTYKRYYLSSNFQIINRYSKNKYNKIIPDFIMFLALPLSMVIGISLYILIIKLLSI